MLVSEIAIVEHQARITFMGVLIEVINSTGIEAAGAPLDAMDLVALLQQQLREVTTVLTGYSGDELSSF